jgi:hypothetical protein
MQRLTGFGGRFFIGFLEKYTQQAQLIRPRCGKSLVELQILKYF